MDPVAIARGPGFTHAGLAGADLLWLRLHEGGRVVACGGGLAGHPHRWGTAVHTSGDIGQIHSGDPDLVIPGGAQGVVAAAGEGQPAHIADDGPPAGPGVCGVADDDWDVRCNDIREVRLRLCT